MNPYDWFLLLWMVLAGGIVGSFLNVVVWRWPQGQSIVRPGSHCPACGHVIRPHHNVPVLGWLMLRGRCHDCGVKISPRYPLVEALTAAMFGLLAVVEVFSGGANLPGRVIDPLLQDFAPWGTAALWGEYAYHLVLLCGLLVAALVEWDEHSLPVRLAVVVLGVGLVAPLVWPQLRPVAVGFAAGEASGGLLAALAGLLAGVLLRTATWPVVFDEIERYQSLAAGSSGRRKKARQDDATEGRAAALVSVYFPLLAVGAFLGWQACFAVGVIATGVQLLASLVGRVIPAVRRVPVAAWVLAVTFVFLIVWAPLADLIPALGGWRAK